MTCLQIEHEFAGNGSASQGHARKGAPAKLPTRRVLVVDGDARTTAALRALLEAQGFVACEENRPQLALATARAFRPEVLLLEYRESDTGVSDVAWQFACSTEFRELPLAVLTSAAERDVRRTLPPRRIAIVRKPVDPGDLQQTLREL